MAANESQTTKFKNLMDLYMKFELAEGICLSVLSILTVSTNILLLVAIWKDPERSFRSPTTYFLIGLAIADLFTGISTEPFFAVFYIMNFQSGGKHIPSMVTKLYNIGQSISTVTISSSYLIILGLSISQYIAIKWPHKYKVLITRNRVIASVVLSWVYFICFTLVLSCTPNIDSKLFLKVDLALHPVLISTVLFITLILLYRVFSQEVQRRRSYRKSNIQNGTVKGKSENLQRQFIIVTFYLAAILLISALPHIAVQFVWLYAELSEEGLYYIFMALRVRDLLLFLKVALDAFIYAWRLPSYRKALKRSINYSKRGSKSSVEIKA
ncbi:dopamine D2-like receptor [Stylophora pistillata]|uniref:dopamine D2-like receptor n=1 Tax=Stylophora pistillata TaxID=50429 RepID=UPI000C04721B|nr:dopamine D2-like receptor [Stylophora pistillata]